MTFPDDFLNKVICGDCLEVLRFMPDNSIDSIVTDPPYGLSFMGKHWDYDVPKVEVWAECLRVLKPGGHILCACGTRTQHRMAVNIEDAGFEIRDLIAWIYGSGFPKSLDIGKAVDKLDAVDVRMKRKYRFTAWMVDACPMNGGRMDAICNTNTMGRHWTDTPPSGKQPDIPTRIFFEMLRPYFICSVPKWVEKMVDERTVESENFKRREVVGQKTAGLGSGKTYAFHDENELAEKVLNITAPATEPAKQWTGWGTALKPAMELWTLARKPLIGTVAENVLRYGTGGINVDGGRVGIYDKLNGGATTGSVSASDGWDRPWRHDIEAIKAKSERAREQVIKGETLGRFPANLIHDGSEEVLEGFPETDKSTGGKGIASQYPSRSGNTVGSHLMGIRSHMGGFGDSGSAARFFYCAKASKQDRDDGCEGLDGKYMDDGRGIGSPGGTNPRNRGAENKRNNFHPTVKPTDLMRYLCRLVTPPNGIVLDPFIGSGSTGKGAKLEGLNYIGIEREAEYCEIARKRIAATLVNKKLNFKEAT